MQKLVFFTGSNPRHGYVAQQLWEQGCLTAVIQEQRLDFDPVTPNGLSDHMLKLWKHHFVQRKIQEERFFADSWQALEDTAGNKLEILKISTEETNSSQVVEFLKKYQPDLVLSYGCHFIKQSTQQAVPNALFWNIHGGLSPFYRGTVTHFWPSYFLEPQMTGMTLHYTQSRLDGGDILLQTTYPMTAHDTLHAVACRTVQTGAQQIAQNIASLKSGVILEGSKQSTSGKLFLNSDWRPEHLRVIYDLYDDAIVDAVLNQELTGRILEHPINQFALA